MITTITNESGKRNLPNKAFDLEYSTQFKREMQYLKDHGFTCSYIKKTKDYGVPVYKYTKTPELFRAVAAFYEEIRNEKQFNEASRLADENKVDDGLIMHVHPIARILKQNEVSAING